MRICYVANSRYPSERAHMIQMVHMMNALSGAGHEVTLVVTDRKTTITEEPEAYYGTPIRFEVVRIPVPDMAGASPSMPHFIRPWAYLLQRFVFSYRAARHIRKGAYALIYGRDEWVLWLISCWARIPMVWESHEAKFSLIARSLIRRLKLLVVISEGIRDLYTSHGVPEYKIMVAHDAVDERFFEPHISKEEAQNELGIMTEKPVAMYIGGLDTWKGVTTLFSVRADAFNVYVIGGKEKEIEALKKEYPHVHFLGARPYKDLARHQQAADVLVIPNTATNRLSNEYTSPLKLFTYMTSGKPIVASRIPSITNILSKDEAYFFTPDDPVSLQETIELALEDPLRNNKTDRVYEKSRQYTWSRRAGEIIKSLENL